MVHWSQSDFFNVFLARSEAQKVQFSQAVKRKVFICFAVLFLGGLQPISNNKQHY